MQHDAVTSHMKKKQQEQINELVEQVGCHFLTLGSLISVENSVVFYNCVNSGNCADVIDRWRI